MTAPLQGPDEANGTSTIAEVDGVYGRLGETPLECPELAYDASKPWLFTDPSVTKATYIVPELELTAGGNLRPLNVPSKGALMLPPSYTRTKSYAASVSNAKKLSMMGEPVVMRHPHCMFDV